MNKTFALALLLSSTALHASLSKELINSCSPPTVPAELTQGVHKLAEDTRVASVLSAEGTQNYQCVEMHDENGVHFVWKFTGPVANLYKTEGGIKVLAGKHFVNPYPNDRGAIVPAWNLTDGSFFLGDKVKKTPAPNDKENNIPWLTLEKYVPNAEAVKKLNKFGAIPGGALSKVTNIQRGETVGGQAPAANKCNQTESRNRTKVQIPYTANYYLYVNKTENPIPDDCDQVAGAVNSKENIRHDLLNSCKINQIPRPLTEGVHAIPAHERLSAILNAEGTQNYQCVASQVEGQTKYTWKFLGPVANLYRTVDGKKVLTGTHFVNPYPNKKGESIPAWKLKDGSFFLGDRAKKTPSPTDKENNIPWLTLEQYPPNEQARKNLRKIGASSGGALGSVKNIQRGDTVGGQAPSANDCNAEEAVKQTKVAVPYTANYYLYVNKHETPLPEGCVKREDWPQDVSDAAGPSNSGGVSR